MSSKGSSKYLETLSLAGLDRETTHVNFLGVHYDQLIELQETKSFIVFENPLLMEDLIRSASSIQAHFKTWMPKQAVAEAKNQVELKAPCRKTLVEVIPERKVKTHNSGNFYLYE